MLRHIQYPWHRYFDAAVLFSIIWTQFWGSRDRAKCSLRPFASLRDRERATHHVAQKQKQRRPRRRLFLSAKCRSEGCERMVQRQCISVLRMPQGATSETRMEVLKIRSLSLSLAGAVELGRNSLQPCAARMKDEKLRRKALWRKFATSISTLIVGNNRIKFS